MTKVRKIGKLWLVIIDKGQYPEYDIYLQNVKKNHYVEYNF